jgi:hypothetical protein
VTHPALDAIGGDDAAYVNVGSSPRPPGSRSTFHPGLYSATPAGVPERQRLALGNPLGVAE